ncbi:MAG: hypothetical protein JWP10_761 [Nocardioidaceae bacterium]|nr:hypothetical protein [Nocardioidaceae bacterium]
MRTFGRDANARARILLLLVLAALLSVTVLGTAGPSPAATNDQKGLAVTLTALSPTYLSKGQPVVLSGTITNTSAHVWTDLQAYLVIPRTPFTTRKQIDELLAGDANAYAGERVVDLEALAKLGNLAPGETRGFSLTVPYASLGISGADGVYPIGAQVLGTDDKGERSPQAIGRDFTFIPKLTNADQTMLPASIIWPFLSPVYRRPDGTYEGTDRLLKSISTDGRMRRVLDIARSAPSSAVTAIIDPALLTALNDIATNQVGRPSARKPPATDIPEAQRTEVQRFLDDLLAFLRSNSTWVIGYARPDVQTLAASGSRSTNLRAGVDDATSQTLAAFGISGRRVSWPVGGFLASSSLPYVRGDGDQPAIVAPSSIKGWSRRDGSLLKVDTGLGPAPIVVDDPLIMDSNETNTDSALAVRQRIVSESALAVLQRSLDPDADSDSTLIVSPTWTPSADWPAANFYSAFDVPWLAPISAESRLANTVPKLDGSLRIPSKGAPALISQAQVSAARQLERRASAISSIADDGDAIYYNQLVAQALSGRWAKSRSAGATNTEAQTDQIDAELSKVKIEGPKSVTLSSTSGRFPLTITNGLSSEITVGVRLRALDSTLKIPDVKAITVGPDQRATVTVDVDVDDVRRANITATLLAPSGAEFGDPATFVLRSSALGLVIWIGMGVAGVLVVAAIARRFVRKRQLMGTDD